MVHFLQIVKNFNDTILMYRHDNRCRSPNLIYSLDMLHGITQVARRVGIMCYPYGFTYWVPPGRTISCPHLFWKLAWYGRKPGK